MIKHFVITCSLLIVAFSSCVHNNQSVVFIDNVKNIQYEKLELETVNIPMSIETCSYSGDSGVDGDHLYFLDHFFGFLYEISPSGKIVQRHLGLGNGPDEIPFRPQLGSNLTNSTLLVMGGTFDFYLFNGLKNRNRLQRKGLEKDNSLEDARAYTFFNSIVIRKKANRFFYNIFSEADYCNPYEHSKEYFKNAHILMEVDIQSGEQKPIGSYSNYYINNHSSVNHLLQISYDIDKKDNFIISYYADSLMYVYDKQFNLIKAFGFEGFNMNKNYGSAKPNLDDFNRVWAEDYPNKGYYYWIEYIDETKMTFRSYQKGSHTEYDGLQIYKECVLIADIEVPKQFKVAGYIAPYYISQIICDEEAETMKFYKFKID